MRTPTWRRWLLATMLGGVAGNLFLAALLGVWLGGVDAVEGTALEVPVFVAVWAGIWGVGGAIGLGIGLGQWRALNAAGAAGRPPAGAGQRAGWVGASVAGGLVPWWPLLFAVILGGSNGGRPVTDAGAYVGGVAAAAALFGGAPGRSAGWCPASPRG